MGHGGMQLSMYNSAYADGLPTAAYLPGVGADQSHFYPNLVSTFYGYVLNNDVEIVCVCVCAGLLLWHICGS